MRFSLRLDSVVSITAIVVVAALCCGCAGLKSRSAMDNEAYAEKYEVGAEKSDIAGKLKQAMDARWVEGESGGYFGVGALANPDSDAELATITYGRESYPWSWISTRYGLEGVAAVESDAGLYGGLDLGLRVQPPSRLAPFVGAGGTIGASMQDIFSGSNDEDNFHSSEDEEWNGLATVYPEVGAHFWLNGSLRFTLTGRYLITSLGRQHDGLWIGGQIAKF